MPNPVYKVGLQSDTDPYKFIMSTSTVDRAGDVVEQDWKLANFRKNPVALWMHNSAEPIGVWESVKVEAGKLVGRMKLAEKGTSELIDRLRSLVEQRVLKAVSVGFMPGEYEALDEDKPWGGLRLSKNELFECSLVSVPMNAEALSFAKAMGAEVPQGVATETGGLGSAVDPAAKQLGIEPSQDSDPPPPKPTVIDRSNPMSLSDKIKAAREELTAKRNTLTELTEKDISALTDEEQELTNDQIEELSASVGVVESSIERLLKAEAALAQKAFDQQQASPAAPTQGAPVQPIQARSVLPPAKRAVFAVACMLKAHALRTNPMTIADSSLKDNPEVGTIIRAATDPASMTDAAWAGPLVQETWGAFMDLIRDTSVYPRLPGMRLEFDRYGKINLPKNVGRGQLAGGFIGELGPIPVKEGAYGSVDLSPKKLAVISTFSKEIAEHSIPAIQGLVQNQMVEDTAETLDTLYMDAEARSVTRPAGIQDTTETGAGNINAATGATSADIIADTKAMIGRMLAARTGDGAVWVMNPLRVLGLRDLQDAASGEFVFRAELAAGTFRGYPFIESQNVAADVVFLQSNGAVSYGNDYAPRIEVSDETTLVFDDTAPDNVLPDTNTQPAKSMFQVDAIAVKFKQGLDWRIVRIGGLQVLTGVAW